MGNCVFHSMKKCQVCLRLHIVIPKKIIATFWKFNSHMQWKFWWQNMIMRDSKIHIIKLLVKPNLLVRKTEQEQATKKNTFSKKKSNYVYLWFVWRFPILLKTNALQVKIFSYILAKQLLYIKLQKWLVATTIILRNLKNQVSELINQLIWDEHLKIQILII